MKQGDSGKIVIHDVKLPDIYSLHKPIALPVHNFKESPLYINSEK